MKSSYFLPEELRNLPLNILMCTLIDYCTERYHDALTNPIRDRWQADSKYYSPEAIIKEVGGEDYLEFMQSTDKEKISRFFSSIFSLKGGRDGLKMLLAFIGIYGKVIDFHTYERDGRFPGLIDPELKPSIPKMNPCEVYVILEVDQSEVTGKGIEFEVFRKVVELFLWSCADLVALLIIRRILDSTMPVISEKGLECSLRQDYGDSMVFNIPYYNSGRTYGDGTVAYPSIEEESLVDSWPPFIAPWTPVQPSSDFVDDETYGRCWKVRPEPKSKVKNTSAKLESPIRPGDYVTLAIPVFLPSDSNVTKMEVSAVGGGALAISSVSMNYGEWQIVHVYDYASSRAESFEISITISTNSEELSGGILIGKPKLNCERRLEHILGASGGEIGMYDKLDLIQG